MSRLCAYRINPRPNRGSCKEKNIPINKAGIEMLREKQPSLKFVKKEDIAAMIYFYAAKRQIKLRDLTYP